MRRLLVLLALAVLVAGCDHEQSSSPAASRAPAAPAAPGWFPSQPPAVDQPGPQADPGQCVDKAGRQVNLSARWTSETAKVPVVTWTHNGVTTPATNLASRDTGSGRGYGGTWSMPVTVSCHDTLAVKVVGTSSTFAVVCVVSDLGHDVLKTGERNCEATYTAP